MKNARVISEYFQSRLDHIPQLKSYKGSGLMLGLEFGFPIAKLRKQLIHRHQIFTGSSKNPNLLRILPPLTIQKKHIDYLINALEIELN